MSKFFVLLAAALLVVSSLVPPSQAQIGLFVDVSTHFIEVPIDRNSPSSGTLHLAATLYEPRFFPSAPAAIYIHGWGGRRLTGTDNLAYQIAAAGYVVLSYTARGFGDGESGGQVTLAGPDELGDLSHVIDWLLDDPNNVIGPRVTKIGVVGASYGGGHGFQIASDPRVSAVCALVGWTDLEESLFPNGTINYRQGVRQFYGGLRTSEGSPPFYNYDSLQFEMLDAAAGGSALGDATKKKLSKRSVAKRGDDGRLQLIEARKPVAPIFIVQSWDDYLFPATQVIDIYSQINSPKQIYFGRSGHPPGGHTYQGEEIYFGLQVLRWFDHFLRGIGGKDSKTVTSAPSPFRSRLYTQNTLPSSDVGQRIFYLRPGALHAKKKKKGGEERTGGIFNPGRIRSTNLGAEIPSEADMLSGTVADMPGTARQLVYTLKPFATETEIFGSNEFAFYVSSNTSSDVDLIVRVYDVAKDGTETEVTLGVMRVEGLTPGEVRRVVFRDFGDNWIFAKGDSLRIKVANMDFPQVRPPGANDNRPSEVVIHHGKEFPSSISLPVRRR